jgi:cell division initiation protein
MNGSAIRKQTFRKKFPGADPEEVSRFLEETAAEFDRMATENAELARRVTELDTQLKDFRSVEKALQQTLAQAQDSTARAVENARREAQLIIQDAELKGAQIVEKSRGELAALREQVTILSARKESIVRRLKMLLHSELDLLKALESGAEAPAQPAEDQGAPAQGRSAEIDDIMKSLESQ